MLTLLLAVVFLHIGPHLLVLALGATILTTSGYAFLAALPVGIWFFFPSFASAYLMPATTSANRQLQALFSGIGLLCTGLCVIAFRQNVPPVYLLPLVAIVASSQYCSRRTFENWIRHSGPPTQVSFHTKMYFGAFYCSTLLSGISLWWLEGWTSLWPVLMIHSVCTALGIIAVFFIPSQQLAKIPKRMTRVGTAPSYVPLIQILADDRVRTEFLLIVLSGALFQGAYSVLVLYLPLVIQSMGLHGVGMFQVVASFGILLGFTVVTKFSNRWGTQSQQAPWLITIFIIGAFFVVLSTRTWLSLSLISFFVFHFLFELIWVQNQSAFFARVRKSEFTRFNRTLLVWTSYFMVSCLLLFAAGIDLFGIEFAITVFVGVILLVGLVSANRVILSPFLAKLGELKTTEQDRNTTAQIAHDIRSPLTTLKLLTGDASADSDRQKLIHQSIEAIEKIASRKSEAIVQEFVRGKIYIEQLLQSIIAVKQNEYADRQIKWVLPEWDLETQVRSNPTEVSAMFSNLINNAVEALPNGTGSISVKRTRDQNELCIEIADSGAGIDDSLLPQLMKRGMSFGKSGGKGLGLWHASQVMEASLGEMEIESAVGEGTRILLYFPL